LQKTQGESEHSWTIDVSTLDDACDLSVKNPNKVEVVDERTPSEIAESIFALNSENQTLINELMEMVK
jgi:type I restriction enzyme M protein